MGFSLKSLVSDLFNPVDAVEQITGALDDVFEGVGDALNNTIEGLVAGNPKALLEVCLIVGVAILCPYAFAAWGAETSAAAVDAAVDADTLAGAGLAGGVTVTTGGTDIAALSAEDLAAASGTVAATGADTATIATSTTAGNSLPAGAAATEVPAAPETLASLGTSTTAGTSATTATVAGGSTSSALGDAVVKAIATTAVSGITADLLAVATGKKAPAQVAVPAIAAPASSVPVWLWAAAAAAVLLLVVES